ncbi:MAG: FAD-dependent thymidylate synthase [Candidatus Aminicenantes bacterium]|nr:FAD-dependent thymidylate synthase [Candidatus Aminicenantes bacterium]
MKVLLAGYNVDSEALNELKTMRPDLGNITPETLSAAYARISRDPRSVDKLRAASREEVERARRSNQNIIFKMGHHSVAEHAVFNFDIIGVSRLAIEEIEKFRLCSYTEKSQRYIKLGDDYILPDEVRKSGQKRKFLETVKAQNALYNFLFKKLRPFFFDKYKALAQNPRKHALLNGWAMEDARYVLSLATLGQLGLTANARNLEFLIRRFAAKNLVEIEELNQKIYALAKEVAPSIILFTEASDFDTRTYTDLQEEIGHDSEKPPRFADKTAAVVDHTPDGDTRLIAALIHTSSALSYKGCLQKAEAMDDRERKNLVLAAFRHMEFFDAVLREFEYVDLTFDLVVSATCFAQLKRHRIATLTAQRYEPELGVMVPPSVKEVGAEKQFLDLIDRTNAAYTALKKNMDSGAEYILTNSHRRRVLIKLNARELYHISRLREDSAAQWDIRNIVQAMSRKAKEAMPLTFLLIGGKDAYPEIYRRIFAKLPKAIPPKPGQ